jgi:hypothetical protein
MSVGIDLDQADDKTFHGVLNAATLASPTIGHSFYFYLNQSRRHHASVHNRSSSASSCGFGFGDLGFGRL